MTGTALVTGADGFIAGYLIAALRGAGWRVVRGVRNGTQPLSTDQRLADFGANAWPQLDWPALLDGVDAVINVAGILREQPGRGQTFDALHHDGPLALARACLAHGGVHCFVQISALGDPTDSPFMASKHRFDQALLALTSGSALRAVVLRPSVVYAADGAYGGTALLRALASCPWVLPLPGHGQWPLQPLSAPDLGTLVVRALADPRIDGLHEVVGPEVLTLAQYQQSWRRWLRVADARLLHVPVGLIGVLTRIGEWLGRGPLSRNSWRMLQRGNVATEVSAHARLARIFGHAPAALETVLATRPSQVQDRWHARLELLGPLLWLGVVLLFLLSAWVGFSTPTAQIEALVAGSSLQGIAPVPLARAAAGADLLLGLALLLQWRPRLVIGAMLALVLTYSLAFGLALPALWLDPLGGLAKNLVVLPALLLLWVLAERR